MENARIEVQNQGASHSIVKLTGSFDQNTVAETARTYEKLIKQGVKRLLIDLTASSGNLSSLMASREKLVTDLHNFERVSILVADPQVAFNVKSVSTHSSSSPVRFTYKLDEAMQWIQS